MISTNSIYFCPRSPKYNLVFPPDSHMIHRCRPGGPIIWVRHVIDPWQWSPHQLPYVTACNGWLPRDQPTRSCALILLHAENSRTGSSEVTFHKGWWFVRKCFVMSALLFWSLFQLVLPNIKENCLQKKTSPTHAMQSRWGELPTDAVAWHVTPPNSSKRLQLTIHRVSLLLRPVVSFWDQVGLLNFIGGWFFLVSARFGCHRLRPKQSP